MSTSTQVSNLKINKMTRAQYDTITPSETELYFLTDDSGITSVDVTGALGYTPYDSSNPSGYVTSSAIGDATITFTQGGVSKGTITVNQTTDATIALDAGGGSGIVDQTYDASSTNPQSGTAVAGALAPITTLIPSAATSSNPLADRNFVNSSIATNTANFIGTFNSVTALEGYSGVVTNNDYAFVINGVVEDNGDDWSTFSALNAYDKSLLTNFDYAWVINGSNFDLYRFDIFNQTWDLRASNIQKSGTVLNTAYNRYKATVSGNTVTWDFEYTLNNSSFTADQWDAINSGVNSSVVSLATSALQPSSVTSTYSATGTAPINGTAVASAISGLSIDVEQTYNSTGTKAISGTGVKSALDGLSIPTTTSSVTSGSSSALTSGGAYTNLVSKVEAGSTANIIKVTKGASTTSITVNSVGTATRSTYLGSITVGGTTRPIYLSNGTPTTISYTIGTSVPSTAKFTDTTYGAGTGLSLSGTTFNHSNSVTSGTAGTSSATSGSTLDVPYVTYDAQGHITASGTHTHTVTGFLTSSSLAPYQLIAPTVNVLSTSGTIALSDNSINSITPSAAVTFTLPTVSDNTKFHQILVQVKLSTVYALTLGTSYFFNLTAPDMSATGVYNLIYEYDKANSYWVVGCIAKGAGA